MKRLEFLLAEKIGYLINVGLQKKIKPDFKISDVTVLTKGMSRVLKHNYGIEGIVLDVDETLKNFGSKIPECNREWLDAVSNEFKIAVLSNGWNREIEEYCNERNIKYIGLGFKPSKGGFKKACQSMGLEPSKVLMIGNDLFADIYGGRRSHLKTAQVSRIKEDR